MNIVKEILELKKLVNKLYCSIGSTGDSGTLDEIDPTVGSHIKAITAEDIHHWNNIEDKDVRLTVATPYGAVGENQSNFNQNISNNLTNLQIEFDLTL